MTSKHEVNRQVDTTTSRHTKKTFWCRSRGGAARDYLSRPAANQTELLRMRTFSSSPSSSLPSSTSWWWKRNTSIMKPFPVFHIQNTKTLFSIVLQLCVLQDPWRETRGNQWLAETGNILQRELEIGNPTGKRKCCKVTPILRKYQICFERKKFAWNMYASHYILWKQQTSTWKIWHKTKGWL